MQPGTERNTKPPDYLLLIIDYCVATYNHYCELPVYQLCRAFRKKISAIAKKYFPKAEEYHLKAQLPDSGRSVTADIAKGSEGFIIRKTFSSAGSPEVLLLKHQSI